MNTDTNNTSAADAPETLLPCPFCGNANPIQFTTGRGTPWVQCTCIPGLHMSREKWNRRAPAPSPAPIAQGGAALALARREVDSALYYLPAEYVVQHEDPFAAMVLTFNKMKHALMTYKAAIPAASEGAPSPTPATLDALRLAREALGDSAASLLPYEGVLLHPANVTLLHIRKALAAINAALANTQDAQAGDTARLDWLEKNGFKAEGHLNGAYEHEWHVERQQGSETYVGEDLRAAIDAAMQTTPEETK